MENRISAIIRIAVAGVVVIAGAAILNGGKAEAANTGTQSTIKSLPILNDGPAPMPVCDPRTRCVKPLLGPS